MRAFIFAFLLAACGGGSSKPDAAMPHPDAPAGDGASPADANHTPDATPGPDAECYSMPMTHFQIINACTTSDKVWKPTHPPLEYDDGGLPPLP
jgi:hypothetical protein